LLVALPCANGKRGKTQTVEGTVQSKKREREKQKSNGNPGWQDEDDS